jgi:hypothetical protein
VGNKQSFLDESFDYKKKFNKLTSIKNEKERKLCEGNIARVLNIRRRVVPRVLSTSSISINVQYVALLHSMDILDEVGSSVKKKPSGRLLLGPWRKPTACFQSPGGGWLEQQPNKH